MKFVICFILTFYSSQLLAQKTVTREILAENITDIHIDGHEMFQIKIVTNKSNVIAYTSHFEGENSNNLVLVSNILDNVLEISSKYQPFFIPIDDKLAAHKVISIKLELSIPENLSVSINSDAAHVFMQGSFNAVNIDLKNGPCELNEFIGSAKVKTTQGQISVNTNYATVNTYTKNGQLSVQPISSGKNRIQLKSLNGNIIVTKTQ